MIGSGLVKNGYKDDYIGIKMKKTIDHIKATRQGGAVERCHTVPHHGSYNVAQHTINCVCLLYALWQKQYDEEPKHNMVKSMLYHDVVENWIGDIPGGMYKHLAVEEAITPIADKYKYQYKLNTLLLTPEEQEWHYAIDKLELWLWCLDQLQLGNKNITRWEVFIRNDALLSKPTTPSIIKSFVKQYTVKRLEDIEEV